MSELEDSRCIADWIRNACRWEVQAPKPGNVHPAAAFDDLTADDFLRSAEIVAPVLAHAQTTGIGRAILAAVERTQQELGRNTNLGIILLLAPLAAVPSDQQLADGVAAVLASTTVNDARLVYRAVRLAQPGGMGRADEQDLSEAPTQTLREVMTLAANRDRIAAQYASGFRDLLKLAVPEFLDRTDRCHDAATTIVGLHLSLMSQLPDTLIARKCGSDVARESADRAAGVLQAGWPESPAGIAACMEFDLWLRADGHRRNPGTTADLVAATLFAVQRDHGWSAE